MTKTSSEVQQQGDRLIKTTTTEGESLQSWLRSKLQISLIIFLSISDRNFSIKVITKSAMQPQQKMSPFAKFRQLDRQNSLPK